MVGYSGEVHLPLSQGLGWTSKLTLPISYEQLPQGQGSPVRPLTRLLGQSPRPLLPPYILQAHRVLFPNLFCRYIWVLSPHRQALC